MKTFTLKKTAGYSLQDIHLELKQGGRFVIYTYCISTVAVTFKRISSPFFIKHNESPSIYHKPYTITSAIFGWWGLPWGPIRTYSGIKRNIKGGIDITDEVVLKLNKAFMEQKAAEPFETDIVITYTREELTEKSPEINRAV